MKSEEGFYDRKRVLMHRKGSNRIGEGFYEVIRVLTKFQVNLVILKEQYLWLYSNQRRGYVKYMGFP